MKSATQPRIRFTGLCSVKTKDVMSEIIAAYYLRDSSRQWDNEILSIYHKIEQSKSLHIFELKRKLVE